MASNTRGSRAPVGLPVPTGIGDVLLLSTEAASASPPHPIPTTADNYAKSRGTEKWPPQQREVSPPGTPLGH